MAGSATRLVVLAVDGRSGKIILHHRMSDFRPAFPPQRSPSPVALDLVEVVRQALHELNGVPVVQN